jgi:hypothetical protein
MEDLALSLIDHVGELQKEIDGHVPQVITINAGGPTPDQWRALEGRVVDQDRLIRALRDHIADLMADLAAMPAAGATATQAVAAEARRSGGAHVDVEYAGVEFENVRDWDVLGDREGVETSTTDDPITRLRKKLAAVRASSVLKCEFDATGLLSCTTNQD